MKRFIAKTGYAWIASPYIQNTTAPAIFNQRSFAIDFIINEIATRPDAIYPISSYIPGKIALGRFNDRESSGLVRGF